MERRYNEVDGVGNATGEGEGGSGMGGRGERR
jgi:hypothetical protein